MIPVVYTYLSRRVFMEADQEDTHKTVSGLPAPQESKAREVLEPAE